MSERTKFAGTFRPFTEQDAREVTEVLHRAYERLARMGLRYWATHQSAQDTIDRAARGECTVAIEHGRIVGTITLWPTAPHAETASWYDRQGIAAFGQFAVEPHVQGVGLGSTLLELAEARAAEVGAREIACDTADHATHLIAWYRRHGYRAIEHVDHRPYTNYCSIILSKSLGPASLPRSVL